MVLPDILQKTYTEPIILYDGHCVLCNGFVKWILKKDTEGLIKFIPLHLTEQSAHISKEFNKRGEIDSLILLYGNDIKLFSSSSLGILSFIKGWKGIAKMATFFPLFIRDTVYKIIAKVRYKIMGKYETCPLVPLEYKSRFLDSLVIE